jgi:hypothetical protein
VTRVNPDGLAALSGEYVGDVFGVVVREDVLAGDPGWKTRAEQAVSARLGRPGSLARTP